MNSGNIRDMNDYMNNFFPWDRLNEAFIRETIKVTDVDGMVEINGHFIFFEAKGPGSGYSCSAGQKLALQRLAKIPGITVLLVRWTFGDKDEKEILSFSHINNLEYNLGNNWDDLWKWCNDWSSFVDKKRYNNLEGKGE